MTDLSCLSCPLCCRQNLGSVEALREHLLYFTYRPIPCPVCRAPITGLPRLVGHLELHLDLPCDPVPDAPSQLCQRRDEGEEQLQQQNHASLGQELSFSDRDKTNTSFMEPLFNTEKITLVQLDLLSVQKELSANSLYDFAKHEVASIKTCSVEDLKDSSKCVKLNANSAAFDSYLDLCLTNNIEENQGTPKKKSEVRKYANYAPKWTTNSFVSTATATNIETHKLQNFSANEPYASNKASQDGADTNNDFSTTETCSSSLSPALQQNKGCIVKSQQTRSKETPLLSPREENASPSAASHCESTADSRCPSVVESNGCPETADRFLPIFGDNTPPSSSSSSTPQSSSSTTPHSSFSTPSSVSFDAPCSSWSSTTTAIRAYVCQHCDLKVVGQDLYFVHLQAHLNDSASSAQLSGGALTEKMQGCKRLAQYKDNVFSDVSCGKDSNSAGSCDVSSGKGNQEKAPVSIGTSDGVGKAMTGMAHINTNRKVEQKLPVDSPHDYIYTSLVDQLDYSSGHDSLSPDVLNDGSFKDSLEEPQIILHPSFNNGGLQETYARSSNYLQDFKERSSDCKLGSSQIITSELSNASLDHHQPNLVGKQQQQATGANLSDQSISTGLINSSGSISFNGDISSQKASNSTMVIPTTSAVFMNFVSTCNGDSSFCAAGNMNTSVVSSNNIITVNAGSNIPTVVASYSNPTVFVDTSYSTDVVDHNELTFIDGNSLNITSGYDHPTDISNSNDNTGITDANDPTVITDSNNSTVITDSNNSSVITDSNDPAVISGTNNPPLSNNNIDSSASSEVANANFDDADSVNCESEVGSITFTSASFNSFNTVSDNTILGLSSNASEDVLLDISLNTNSFVSQNSHNNPLSANYLNSHQNNSFSLSAYNSLCSLSAVTPSADNQVVKDFGPVTLPFPVLEQHKKKIDVIAANSSVPNAAMKSKLAFHKLTLIDGDEGSDNFDEASLSTRAERRYSRPMSPSNEEILDSPPRIIPSSTREKKYKLESSNKTNQQDEDRICDLVRRSSKSTSNSKEPYLHKKFHHERKGTGSHSSIFAGKRDVGKYYIPNLQSVWVNRLNDCLAKNNSNYEPLINDYYEDDYIEPEKETRNAQQNDYHTHSNLEPGKGSADTSQNDFYKHSNLEHRKATADTSQNNYYKHSNLKPRKGTANTSQHDFLNVGPCLEVNSDNAESPAFTLSCADSNSRIKAAVDLLGEITRQSNTITDCDIGDPLSLENIDINDVCDPSTDRAIEEVETRTLTNIIYSNYYCGKGDQSTIGSLFAVATKENLADITDDPSSECDSYSNMVIDCDTIDDFDSQSFDAMSSQIYTKKILLPKDDVKSPAARKEMTTDLATNDGVLQNSDNASVVAEVRPKKRADQHLCTVCNKTFLNPGNIRRHIREAHNPKRDLTCKECKRKFCSERQLMNHMGVHRQQKMHACDLCGHRCFTVAGIRTHKFEIHTRKNGGDDDQRSFKCLQCPEAFTKKFSLLRHVKRKHEQVRYTCSTCDKIYTCSENLQKHMLSHSTDGPQGFSCGACDSLFKSKFALKRHLSIRHPYIDCSKGNATVKGNISTIHEIVSTMPSAGPSEEQPLVISNTIVNNGEGPIMTLTNEATVPCIVGDDSTGDVTSILTRVSPAHPSPSTVSAATSPSVTLSTVAVVRRFACPQCPQRYTRKDSLTQHLRTHTDERPFVCNVCDMAFSRRGLLNTHRDKHASSPRHRCQYCDKMFKFKVSLKHHSCLSKSEAE